MNVDEWTAGESQSEAPCRTLPLAIPVKRCFPGSVMPLQLTDGATQEDPPVHGTWTSKWRPARYIPTRFILKAQKQLHHNSRDYSGGGPWPAAADKVGSKCANCWSGFHSFCSGDLFALVMTYRRPISFIQTCFGRHFLKNVLARAVRSGFHVGLRAVD